MAFAELNTQLFLKYENQLHVLQGWPEFGTVNSVGTETKLMGPPRDR
jgi:hypothetical protein